MDSSRYDQISYPELFVGIAGPIGIDIDGMTGTIIACLKDLGYESSIVKLTIDMLRFGQNPPTPTAKKFDDYMWKMDYANKLRKSFGPNALSAIAIDSIRMERRRLNRLQRREASRKVPDQRPISRRVFIVRQFKHPAEVEMMRRVYGPQFILVSGYASEADRLKKLCGDIRHTESTKLKTSVIASKALTLIERDASESEDSFGQQLRDTFHLADLFVEGNKVESMKKDIDRFLNAFFGRADLSPRKSEYGMYAAKSASLRSLDLARQIGAAIFSDAGELLTQGCNEVPKAFGGTYWEGEDPDFRDAKKGFDPNDQIKKEVLRDAIERLREAGFLTDQLLKKGDDINIANFLTRRPGKATSDKGGALAKSSLMDATEYGRVVHAEMCAICDAARLGRSLKGAILYTTTFPCHNCTKHIIASGIRKVIYLEPYVKSKAAELHPNEIELESDSSENKVSFMPFLGISPYRYRSIFQKGRRKDGNGKALTWISGEPKPLVDFSDYTRTSEVWAMRGLVGS